MNTFKSEKLAFYKWIHKWVTTNNISTEGGPVDTPQIAAVLQTMGYKLETVEHVSINKQSSSDTNKIEVKCNKSGMRAILSKQLEMCICPSSESANEGHFWSVSGTGPACSQDNLNRIDETHSTLIPTLSKEKSMLVRDILTKLFAIISDTDMNQNDDCTKHNSSWSRRRSLSDLARPTLIRQDTWEEDLKTIPPISTSSPLPNKLCKSMSQMSLNSDKEQMLTEILLVVKDNLDKALVLLPNKNDSTFTKTNEKRVPDINFSPHRTKTLVTNNVTPDLHLNKTPRKLQFQQDKENTPKSSTKSTEKRQFVMPLKFGTFTKKTVTPNKNPAPFVKKDTPIPIYKKLALPLSSGIPDRRLSLGTYSRNSSVRANLNLSGSSPGRNNTKLRTGVSSFGFKSPAPVRKTDVASP